MGCLNFVGTIMFAFVVAILVGLFMGEGSAIVIFVVGWSWLPYACLAPRANDC